MRVLFTPSCWITVKPYSSAWDLQLRALMEKHTFKRVDGYTAMLGHLEVWIENHPYASFNMYGVRAMPSRATALYAMDKYYQDVVGETTS